MGYPKEVTTKAWNIMDARREQGRQLLLLRKKEIHQKIPRVAEIEREMQRTAAYITRSMIISPTEAERLVAKLATENTALQQERASLLRQNGFSEDYLTEKHNCNLCNDTGYVGIEQCSCFKMLLRQQAFLELSSVSDGKDSSFDTFELAYYSNSPDSETGITPRERMKDVADFCRQYANSFSRDSDSLLMLGRTGLGKTHLSLAIAWQVIDQGGGVVYIPVQRLMDRLEANKFSYEAASKEKYAQDLEAILTCDLLVLDDLGTEFQTSFTSSSLYSIINARLVENRPTIINTNLEPRDLEGQYTQRMASRLMFGYKPLRFVGEDIRFLKRQQKQRK